MYRRLLSSCLLLCTLAVSGAHAAGVNLRWNNCFSEGGLANKNFACNANIPNHPLTASFELPVPVSGVSGIEAYFDLSFASSVVPPWWQFTAGGCRANRLSANSVINPNNTNCEDWSQGFAAGGLANYSIGTFGPNTARIITGFAVAASALADLQSGTEYFLENLVFTSQNTIGAAACAGCSTPACIAVEKINVVPGTSPGTLLTQPAHGLTSNFATWQGGAGAPSLPNATCVAVVPTRNTTWSAVKSLYR